MPAEPALDELGTALQYDAVRMAAHGRTSKGALRRLLLLRALADLLPPEVGAAHAEEVMSRRHVEEFPPDILSQVSLATSA